MAAIPPMPPSKTSFIYTNNTAMKKALLTLAAACLLTSLLAQPQLKKDNIDEVLAAMT